MGNSNSRCRDCIHFGMQHIFSSKFGMALCYARGKKVFGESDVGSNTSNFSKFLVVEGHLFKFLSALGGIFKLWRILGHKFFYLPALGPKNEISVAILTAVLLLVRMLALGAQYILAGKTPREVETCL